MDEFSKAFLMQAIGRISRAAGFATIGSSSLDILVDVLRRYMLKTGSLVRAFAEHGNRTGGTLADIESAFEDMGVNVGDLKEYVESDEARVAAIPVPQGVPKYPVPKQSTLNFLDPACREAALRPEYIDDHFPPMHASSRVWREEPEEESGTREETTVAEKRKRRGENSVGSGSKAKMRKFGDD